MFPWLYSLLVIIPKVNLRGAFCVIPSGSEKICTVWPLNIQTLANCRHVASTNAVLCFIWISSSEAPCSCAHFNTESVHDGGPHPCLNQCWKTRLFECLPVIRYNLLYEQRSLTFPGQVSWYLYVFKEMYSRSWVVNSGHKFSSCGVWESLQ